MTRIQITPSFEKKLEQHINAKFVSPCIRKLITRYRSELPPIILEKVKQTPTWQSILGYYAGAEEGDLQAVLGLVDPDSIMAQLEEQLLESITISTLPGSSRGFVFGMLRNQDIIDLINAPFGSYVSQGRNGKQSNVDWLEWLLLGNGQTNGYYIEFEDFKSQHSRSGRAVMKKGGHWSILSSFEALDVPSNSNFLVEAFADETLTDRLYNKFRKDLTGCLQSRGRTK